ncbi:hypothetical protein WS68_04835 [Burkholderia sp. TSV86]|nr:hypothetical protein WS68_04835 [Burkholderia sp. TSV86]
MPTVPVTAAIGAAAQLFLLASSSLVLFAFGHRGQPCSGIGDWRAMRATAGGTDVAAACAWSRLI